MTSSALPSLPLHDESKAWVSASPDRVFAFLDDHKRLSSHMSRSSWRMGGGRMETVLDKGRGRTTGSHIRMSGRMLGMELSLDEVVTERLWASRKVWETVGSPRLLVIGPYRMGFELAPQETDSLLTVFIDYALPGTLGGRLLGLLFGRYYARWCTRTMVDDAVKYFAAAHTASVARGV